jgi:7-cyano-7-deazaguanine reductase
MDPNKNQSAVISIASKHLGQVGGAGYSDKYDPSLLVAVPRYLNREAYSIQENNLPFVGVDAWNAYEVSAITEKGLPVAGMLKIVCPADSPFHVESKSIKLYLNSFNMTPFGKTAKECIKFIEDQVSKDLTELLQGEVTCTFFSNDYSVEYAFDGFEDLSALVDLDEVEFTSFHSDASQLKIWEVKEENVVKKLSSNLLRSNCRVTNQPDWGDVYIHMEGTNVADEASLAQYIVSHRQVSHFHEEICEMVFTHLSQAYQPEKLMVACLYTRRGGIDINPIRATHADMIPAWFAHSEKRMKKTLRQ